MSNLNPLTLEAALSEVADWITAVNYEQAVARCNELIASYPDAIRILRLRAQAFEQSNAPVRAADDYGRVLEALPADGMAAIGLARCQLAMDQTREAVLTARQVLDHDPQNRDAQQIAAGSADEDDPPPEPGRIAAARAKFSVGMVNRAVAELRRFLEGAPDRVDAQVVLAEMLWRSGLKITTAELCQGILDAQPDCLNAHVILHNIWSRAGNTALEAHATVIDRLDPDRREMRTWLGDASPFPARDVPALVETPPRKEPAAEQDADDADRSAWVDELIAAAAPVSAPVTHADTSLSQMDEDADAVTVPAPLEWMPAAEGEEEVREDDVPQWLTNLRLQPAQPNASDTPAGQDPEIEPTAPLQWTTGADETEQNEVAQPAGVMAYDVAAPDVAAPAEPSAPASRGAAASAGAAAAELNAITAQTPTPVDTNAQNVETRVETRIETPLELHPETPRRARKSGKAKAKKAKLSNDDLLALARKAVETANYDQAVDFYARLISAGKKLDAVLADLDVATHAYPDVRRFHALLGDVYTRKGDVNAALMAYHRALGIN